MAILSGYCMKIIHNNLAVVASKFRETLLCFSFKNFSSWSSTKLQRLFCFWWKYTDARIQKGKIFNTTISSWQVLYFLLFNFSQCWCRTRNKPNLHGRIQQHEVTSLMRDKCLEFWRFSALHDWWKVMWYHVMYRGKSFRKRKKLDKIF